MFPLCECLLQNQAIGFVVVHNQHVEAAKVGGFLGIHKRARQGLNFKVDCEMKRAALSLCAFEPDAPAHRFDQTGGDRQAQARTAVTACGGAVGLVERREYAFLFVLWNADARIANPGSWSNTPSHARSKGSMSALATTSPRRSVNLMAFPIRLTRTWRSRVTSPRKASGTSAGKRQANSIPLL